MPLPLSPWYVFCLLCLFEAACLSGRKGESSSNDGACRTASQAEQPAHGCETVEYLMELFGNQESSNAPTNANYANNGSEGIGGIGQKILSNEATLSSLFKKQKELRESGVFVGVHAKTQVGLLFHILADMGMTTIKKYGIESIKDRLTTEKNESLRRYYQSQTVMSASFSVLDTTPRAGSFLDVFLAEANQTRSEQDALDETLHEEKVDEDEMDVVEDAFEAYKTSLFQTYQLSRSFRVPFVIRTLSAPKRTKASYDQWADDLSKYAYVSESDGYPILATGVQEDLLGSIVNSMKDAFLVWMSLPPCADQRGSFSWAALARKNMRARKDSRYRTFSSAKFSQLRIPYRYIYEEPMFELDPVYDDDVRRDLDVGLCHKLEEGLNRKSRFCEKIRNLHIP
eukprot:TRINITY_DN22266_c0_g1_i1.p1 TRINITY_DN22266_c0_g1~~TRINITY_DN22266_c0_g1_i1.p1  ORF type:complete len:399 (+),score=32.60 TRINITY_DN22266_c0_g1_i1:31-1227(+)